MNLCYTGYGKQKSREEYILDVYKFEDRKKYIKDLLDYLKVYKNKLSADSLKRYEKNPLRILDSKNEEDINIISNAPKILEYLNNESKNNFQNILNNLKALNIPYINNIIMVMRVIIADLTICIFIK